SDTGLGALAQRHELPPLGSLRRRHVIGQLALAQSVGVQGGEDRFLAPHLLAREHPLGAGGGILVGLVGEHRELHPLKGVIASMGRAPPPPSSVGAGLWKTPPGESTREREGRPPPGAPSRSPHRRCRPPRPPRSRLRSAASSRVTAAQKLSSAVTSATAMTSASAICRLTSSRRVGVPLERRPPTLGRPAPRASAFGPPSCLGSITRVILGG